MAIRLRSQWRKYIEQFPLPAPAKQIAVEARDYRWFLRDMALDPNEAPPCLNCPDHVVYACKYTGQECREFRTFCEDPPRYYRTYGGICD